jgi:DNA-binding transcriptional MocR family regulator
MFKEVFRNLITRKPTIPFPEGFSLSPEERARIVSLKKKIDSVFRAIVFNLEQ